MPLAIVGVVLSVTGNVPPVPVTRRAFVFAAVSFKSIRTPPLAGEMLNGHKSPFVAVGALVDAKPITGKNVCAE